MAAGKYMLFIINVIFVLAGAALCIAGIIYYTNAVTLFDIEEYVEEFGDFKFNFFLIAIVLGATIFFISFLGCCGAIKENLCMLSTYSIILIILGLIKTSLILYFYFKKDDLYENITVALNEGHKKFPDHLEKIQQLYHCCGIDDKTYSGKDLPDSCCKTPPCTESMKYPTCSVQLQTDLSYYELTIGIILALIVVFEFLAATVSCCLGHNSRKETDYRPYIR